MTLRFDDLTSFRHFQDVERLEGEIWGPIDLVPVPMMAVSVKRGGVLVGAYDGERLAGFVYSFPALRREAPHNHEGAPASAKAMAGPPKPGDGGKARRREGSSGPPQASHWSHMLGVHPDYRGAGLGRDLKLAQRERVLALGLDLIEWTYDPLQALNANLNIVTLGAVIEEYEENVYGESISPLHGGLPTDRFVCQWWIRRPHVVRRVDRAGRVGRVGQVDRVDDIRLVAREVAEAPVVNETTFDGTWLECGTADLARTEPRVTVDIPADFTGMLAGDTPRALRWRLRTREIFTHYFRAGYRVVDFTLHREHHRGRYLLTSIRSID